MLASELIARSLVLLTALVAARGQVPAEVSTWDALLKEYVTPQWRVDYDRWKLSKADTAKLDGYLAQIASRWPDNLPPAARKAALINAYNALTVRWVLQNYPVESIWRTSHPFTAARHTVNGRKISLDQIESELREIGDPRIHGALVCAARSCPPLRREAYTPERINEQLDDNMRAWLANPNLNDFFPDERVAIVSMIFKWYAKDFEPGGKSLKEFLAKYIPPGTRLGTIKYKPYQWGLNDISTFGADYTNLKFMRDRLRNSL